MRLSIRSLNAQAAKKANAEAATIPTNIVVELEQRAHEALASGEPHKITGGWVAHIYYGQGYSITGLLQVASDAVKKAQAAYFASL